MIDVKELCRPYNPWWQSAKRTFPGTPQFRRPIFNQIRNDIQHVPQIISITGPRRVGKSTLLIQLIEDLIRSNISADRLLYYSFDDPALLAHQDHIGEIVDQMVQMLVSKKDLQLGYLFFDEIQRLINWELFLKKYYDLKYPLRIVISGSASTPIFKKSRESLLGRIKDYHLLPFSFREYLLYDLRAKPALAQEVEKLYEQGKIAQGVITKDPFIKSQQFKFQMPSIELQLVIEKALEYYLLNGGFPEVWELADWVKKQEYLFDNQVKKVLYEDLVLAAEFRKPELLKRFYISLLEMPGKEINIANIAAETGINAQQIEKYLPLLEMTDMVYRIEKFRKSPLRIRKGMMKFYLVDLALRNAVLRLTEALLQEQDTLGLYAENLVFLAIKKWRGTIQVDYYRERDSEVDFIVHVGPQHYLPIEVKYRNQIYPRDLISVKKFAERFHRCMTPIIVTKKWDQFGYFDGTFWLPLPMFLLLFD